MGVFFCKYTLQIHSYFGALSRRFLGVGEFMKILICDDEIKYLTNLKVHVEEYMNNRFIKFTIDTSTNPTEIFDNDTAYDLAFLDIEMNEINGISLAQELKQRNGKVVIFFVTSYNKYQDDAMDLRAFRFFEKPFNPERLYSGLDKAMEYIDESYVDFYLYSDKSHHNRKVVLNSTHGKYITKEKLEDWCELLPNTFFYQVHKSFLVNLHYVNRYNYSELFLNNGDRIPIASRKQSDFHKYWFAYLRRR